MVRLRVHCVSFLALVSILPSWLVHAKPALPASPGSIQGQVQVIPKTGPLAEQQVFIDGGKRVELKDGRFAAKRATATYDLYLLEKVHQEVTVYQGLARRDPVLWVFGNWRSRSENRLTTVHGILRGGFPFPVRDWNHVSVFFSSAGVSGSWQMHSLGGDSRISAGPRFGRMHVAWSGAETITGDLFALGETAEENKPWVGAWLAHKTVSLTDKKESIHEVAMQPIPIGHISGSVSIDGHNRSDQIQFSYRLPKKRGRLPVAVCPVRNTYDCRLPDLSSLGGDYCAHINYQFPSRHDANGETTRCGAMPGMTDFSFRVGPPPTWIGAEEQRMSPDTVLTWNDQGEWVYRVHLYPNFNSKIHGPTITVYTTQTSVRWPDLKALGFEFPDGAIYRCKVTRLSIHAPVDNLASPHGQDDEDDFEVVTMPFLELKMVRP